MIIDCHYHYFKSQFDLNERLKTMDEAKIDKLALISPICPPFKSEPNSLPMIFMRKLMGKKAFYPLLKKLLCTFEEDGINILGKHVPIYFIPDNASVFAAAEMAEDRFYAYVTINPNIQKDEDIRAEILKYSSSNCFCGVKAHPFYHQYDVDKLEYACKVLEPLRKPMLIHLNFDSKNSIFSLIDKYPRVNFILAHCAFPYFDLLWPELRERRNAYVDISSGCYVDAKTAGRCVEVMGADHVLYGSDGPYGTLNSDGNFDMRYEYEFATAKINNEDIRYVRRNNFYFMLSEPYLRAGCPCKNK